jgi:hypothetical protein
MISMVSHPLLAFRAPGAGIAGFQQALFRDFHPRH